MLEKINWQNTSDELTENGFVALTSILSPSQCNELIALYDLNQKHEYATTY